MMSLTARLMGDPNPHRFDISDRIMRRVSAPRDHGPRHIDKQYEKRGNNKTRIRQVLEALKSGPKTNTEVSGIMGVSDDAAGLYLMRAAKIGLASRAFIRNVNCGGRRYEYRLTVEGERELGRSRA